MTAISVPADGTLNWAPPLRQAILDINAGKLDTTALDATVAPVLSNPASAARTALNATYAPLRGLRFFPIGDSLTYIDGGYLGDTPLDTPVGAYRDGSHATGMFAWANTQLGHALTMAGNGGVPGDTSEMMLARLGAALAVPSDIVSVLAGSNDFTQTFPASRTITALTSIYAQILATGRRLLVLTLPPRASMTTPEGHLYVATLNRWIKGYARSTPGVILADIAAVIADPVTGVPYSIPPNYPTTDGTHLSAIGAQWTGRVISDALRPHLSMSNIWSDSNADPLNLSRNASNVGATGTVANGITGTPGTQWTASGSGGTVAAACSKVARTDGFPGEWSRLVIGAGNTATLVMSGAVLWGAGVLAAGDTVTAAVEVRVTGIVGCSAFMGGIYHPNSQAMDLKDNWSQGTGPVTDGIYVFMVEGNVIAATATYVQVRVAVTATAGTVDVGRSAVFKTA